MKSPPIQYTDSEAHDMVEAFITDPAVAGVQIKHSDGSR